MANSLDLDELSEYHGWSEHNTPPGRPTPIREFRVYDECTTCWLIARVRDLEQVSREYDALFECHKELEAEVAVLREKVKP